MKRIGLLVAVTLFLAGCTTYYRITDVGTNQHYYTTSVTKKSSGAVVFKDSRTGAKVTLQSSEITKVSREEFKHGDQTH